MKLVKQAKGVWHYFLNAIEADYLLKMIKRFPLDELAPVKISKSDKHPKAREREKLLNESLAEHRKELKNLAQTLITPDKFKPLENGLLMTLAGEERETLLQILNDIRVGCWRALGKPEKIHTEPPKANDKGFAYWSLMELAGYFECGLIITED